MILSRSNIARLISPLIDSGIITDFAADYGEPGYSFRDGATTPLFLLGNWWCQCKRAGASIIPGHTHLHTVQDHHPRLWSQLEAQGVEYDFYDEWWVDDDTNKAYRTQPDSYIWQSVIQWNDDTGSYLTPDSDDDDWLGWAKNNPDRCLMANHREMLERQGFIQQGDAYHSGLHQGMDDRPGPVLAEIQHTAPSPVDVVFLLNETSQFYVSFTAWVRPVDVGADAE